MATHANMKNPQSHLGKEIYLRQWDTLIYKGEQVENEHWWLVFMFVFIPSINVVNVYQVYSVHQSTETTRLFSRHIGSVTLE